MSEINLLPDELKEEEQKEASRRRQPGPIDIFHLPDSKQAEKDKPFQFDKNAEKEPLSVKAKDVPNNLQKTEKKENLQKKTFFNWLFGNKNNYQNKKPAITVQEAKKPIDIKSPQPGVPSNKDESSLFSRIFKQKKPSIIKMQKIADPGESEAQEVDGQNLKLAEKLEKLTQPSSKEIDVNLLPEGTSLISLKRLTVYFCATAVVGLLLVAFVYFWLIYYGKGVDAELSLVESELSVKSSKIAENEENFNHTIEWGNKIESLKKVLDKHVYWSKLFPALEKKTIPDVYYNGINVASDGSVTLTGNAPNFLTLAKQYLVFKDSGDVFTDFEISGIQGDSEQVGFSVWLKLAPSLYYSPYYLTTLADKK